ncbi:MAG TPA: ABC transporter ATP-binding protein [Burkholderiales bacterium]|nr:ABC transporter ATP-binding protein [Burkholderiales bacterium]
MTALLDIRDLDLCLKARPSVRLLRRVSLAVNAGHIVGLVGESGAGKTMVGRVVLGIAPGNARVTGSVVFDGRDITHLSESDRRHLLGREIAFIPQNPMTALNPVERIEPQMTDVLRMHLGMTRDAAHGRALEMLREVRLREPEKVLRQYPHELSGGMRQRVLLAIAFACKPKLVIADEPTTALDVTIQKQILRLIKELQRISGTAILFITHDLGVVAKLCDHVAVMHGGRVLESETAAQLFARPAHDYTRALFAATPRFDRPGGLLQAIPAALTQRLADEARELDSSRRRDGE